MVEGDKRMCIEAGNMVGIEVVRMTGAVTGIVIGVGVGFETVCLTDEAGVVLGTDVEPQMVNSTDFELAVQFGTGLVVAGLGAETVFEVEPKEPHNYYTAAAPDLQGMFGKHKDILGC